MKTMNLKNLVFDELSENVKNIDWRLPNNEIRDLHLAELVRLGYNQYTLQRHVSEYKKYCLLEDMKDSYKHILTRKKGSKRNVLIISDTHIPYENKKALEAVKQAYIDYNITDVIHIGDVHDGHNLSYHETSLEAEGANAELQTTIDAIKPWYKAFPKVTVLNSNHDGLVKRKAQSARIAEGYFKPLNEALGIPGWTFVDFLTIGDVQFNHGLGGDARSRAKQLGMSVVQGHYHGKKYVEYVDHHHNTFAMQVGCLVDKDSFAMEYGKFAVQANGFGVILDIENNPTPILLNV